MNDDDHARGAAWEGAGEDPAEQAGSPRWYQRALPVTAIAGLGLAAVALALPGLDDDIELSTSRQPQPFVELFLSAPPAELCDGGDAPRVRFRVVSHLEELRRIGYTISVTSQGREVSREVAKLRIGPGQAKSVWTQVAAPDAPYTVTVDLRNRPETVRVHCPGSQA